MLFPLQRLLMNELEVGRKRKQEKAAGVGWGGGRWWVGGPSEGWARPGQQWLFALIISNTKCPSSYKQRFIPISF